MAHRDLKPANVLVNLVDPSNRSSRACSVKIADFGLTKTNNASRTYKDLTTNTGTARYMAPEVISIQAEGHPARTELNPRKADAYSFGIMCYEILTGKTFGDKDKAVELKKQVEDSAFSPDLEKESGPRSLQSLIKQCWDNNFRSRPDFEVICQALRYIKGLLLRDDQQKLHTDIKFTSIEVLFPVMQGPWRRPYERVRPQKSASWGTLQAAFWVMGLPRCFNGLFNDKAASIKWMGLKCQHWPPRIRVLEVGYASSDGQEYAKTYGKDLIGTTYTKIEFKPGEYIKQISGCTRESDYFSVSLSIHTNFNSYGPFGHEMQPFRTLGLVTMEGEAQPLRSGTGRVLGFFGEASDHLGQSGVWIIPDGQEDGDPSYLYGFPEFTCGFK